jgi:hypothetical protein
MAKRNFRDLFRISEQWLGRVLEIFQFLGVLFGILVDYGLI